MEVDDGFEGNLTVPLVLYVNTHPLETQRLAETLYLTRVSIFKYYLRDTFFDPNNDTISYYLSGAPSWLSLTGDVMEAQPSVEGDFNLRILACDSYDFCASKNLTLVILPINVKPFLDKGMPDQTVYTYEHFIVWVPDDAFNDINGDP